ncbi:MAG TPA: DUF411 domain-containing protein [Paracoccaceae bacterium]|nr:DUF411 domain-containing protein [Paracoccaceae bacterium]
MKTNILVALGAAAVIAAGGASYVGLGSAEEAVPVTADLGAGTLATIYRDPGCGCCDSYAEYLEAHGFEVELVDDPEFDQRSIEVGVPEQGLGCHLATIDGYAVSGLVPADIIRRLLDERPAITGITLPGMPANAPGMAPEKTGTLRTYAFGPEGVSVFSDE